MLPTGSPIVPHTKGPRVLRILLLAGFFVILGWFVWLYGQIHFYATHDQARPADAIAVFWRSGIRWPSLAGVARPSGSCSCPLPEHLAPLVITLGGGGDPRDSEGGVGHDYLLAHGVPENQIIAETQSTNTEESAARLAAIARENHLNRILAVSDGTHLFRIHALCTSMGSPYPLRPARRLATRLLGRRHAPDARNDQLHALAVEGALKTAACAHNLPVAK